MAKMTKGEIRKALVLDTALDLLAEQGARGVVHRSVDNRAGLPEGSTSNVFRTRAALMNATVEHHVARELEFAEVARSQLPEKLTIKQLAEVLSSSVEGLVSPDLSYLTAARYEIYLEARRNPDVAPRVAAARAAFKALLADLLRQAGVKRPDQNSGKLLTLIDGLSVDRLFHPETALSHADVASLLEMFLQGLK